jgi:hypothetical protein
MHEVAKGNYLNSPLERAPCIVLAIANSVLNSSFISMANSDTGAFLIPFYFKV